MKFFFPTSILFLVGANVVSSNHLCSKYTTALFVNDTGANQLTLIEAVVNLAVLGDAEMNVPGILAQDGGLTGFFTGAAGNTTNRDDTPVSINFLDGASNQETLLVHLYQFFGRFLGCSAAGFPAYVGVADMYDVHKFMDITFDQNNYFIGQVGAAALALGVTANDVTTITSLMDTTFNTRCPPIITNTFLAPEILIGTNPSICIDKSCPLAFNATCEIDDSSTIPPVVDDVTICMKYTSAVFTNDTADNELALITLVVNLAVLGDSEMNVSGILADEGGLAGFFSSTAGNTTNRGGAPVSINFLDGASNQDTLLLHLYQFFGALLGCTAAGFPEYTGVADMYEVHKFMGITLDQNDYFIGQVGAAALALGVSADDVTTIANVLDLTFNTRCPPLLDENDGVPSFLIGTNPSICQDDKTCPLDSDTVDADCSKVATPTKSPIMLAPIAMRPTTSSAVSDTKGIAAIILFSALSYCFMFT